MLILALSIKASVNCNSAGLLLPPIRHHSRLSTIFGRIHDTMNILLMGNHACANRGDAAISRGLLRQLRQLLPEAAYTLISRYPVSSAYLLGEPYQPDPLFQFYQRRRGGLGGRLRQYLYSRYLSRYLAFLLKHPTLAIYLPLPAEFSATIQQLQNYDLIIQVGGSNFVDIYGNSQFDWALCSLLAAKPLLLIGHSVGPFQIQAFRQIADTVFQRCLSLQLRESASLQQMQQAGLSISKVDIGSDTAWLVEFPAQIPPELLLRSNKPTVAFTVRQLSPFNHRLQLSQQAYNQTLVQCAQNLIAAGYAIHFVSTCTGIDGYKNDDRMLALELAQMINQPDLVTVEMRELNDLEIGLVLRQCHFTIATRLHSAILALAAGSIAIALSYEHKTPGIFQGLQLPQLCVNLGPDFGAKLMTAVNQVQQNRPALLAQCQHAANQEQINAAQAVTRALAAWTGPQ